MDFSHTINNSQMTHKDFALAQRRPTGGKDQRKVPFAKVFNYNKRKI